MIEDEKTKMNTEKDEGKTRTLKKTGIVTST